ncbi:WD repeat domain-containing protein [Rutstroemia sp. NJR-2017a WRK4]|nr:WD repeat domain-containing protein [Rutstroemia sp. NJR-2017a WRK4]
MLLIGDTTGKVHILSHKEDDSELDNLEEDSVLPGYIQIHSHLYEKGPRMIKYHPDPPPPIEYKEQNLETDRAIGTVQGPNYSELDLDCYYTHIEDDLSQPLLPYYEVQQQEHRKLNLNLESELISRLPIVTSGSDLATHLQNLSLDIDFKALDYRTSTSLVEDRVEVMGDFIFEHESTPRYEIFFKRFKGSRQSIRAGESLDK